jgi:xanthine dehydrogenase accessory factor
MSVDPTMSSPSRAPHDALAAWTALRTSGSSRGALVTLVRADGGASKPIGAHLALAEDGRAFGSVTIGGCADGRALTAAERVRESGVRELLTVPLGEEDALALGLGCAGDVELLVEPVSLRAENPVAQAYAAAETALDGGVRAALVTPLDGAFGRLLMREDGARGGTTGSTTRDEIAAALGAAALRGAAENGLRESGGERWLVQLLTPTRTLLVVGASDIAAAICALAIPLGWRTVLIDPRDETLAEPRFAGATERHAALPAEIVAKQLTGGSGSTAVVVVAHDYKVEIPVLRIALRSRAPYVGMLGSRKRSAAVRALLLEDGVSEAELEQLRTPIGLPIGALGPAEIAVSIVAELIACRNLGTTAPPSRARVHADTIRQ